MSRRRREPPSCDVCGGEDSVRAREDLTLGPHVASWIQFICAHCLLGLERSRNATELAGVVRVSSPATATSTEGAT